MTGEELYKKYKGVKIRMAKDVLGVVCGYSPHLEPCSLVIAVIKGAGWPTKSPNSYDAVIITHKNNPKGYLWIDNSRVLTLSRWQMFLHYLKLR